MPTSNLKLLGAWPSPYANRVQIALKLKSIEYELLEDAMTGKSEHLLKSNPIYKKIPVLIHNGNLIRESHIILEYIDEVWTNGPSIIPSGHGEPTEARFWAAYKLLPALIGTVSIEREEKKTGIQEAHKALYLLEDAFVKCSKGKAFFGGDCIGYLNMALGCFLGWLRVSEKFNSLKLLDEAKTPNPCRWAERFCTDGAVKDVMPQNEKLFEFAEKVYIPMRSSSSQVK